MSSSQLNNFVLTQEDLDEVIITPEECSTQGNERLTITFPIPIPPDPVVVFLHGSIKTHKLEAERPDERTVSVMLPAHKPAEVVNLELYQIPGLPVNAIDSEITLRPRLLLEDKLLYTDMSSYLAELLVQSVTDKTQAFYSVLPPLASLDEKMLEDFDKELTSAVKSVELPDGWSLLQCEDNNTLLHFAARNSLPQLFSLLLSFPGGGTALTLRNSDGSTPFDLARQSNRTSVKAILECSNLLASPPPVMNIASAEVQLLQDINALWIRGQKRDNPSLLELPPWELNLTFLRQQISASIVDDSRLLGASISNPASFNKGEEASPLPPNVGEVLIRGCVRKAWSRVVGNGRSRSVGTGLNELHRLQESQSLIEALKIKASERVLNKEVGPCGWSISCPSLCDGSVTELVHSLTSSGSNIEKPVAPNGFTPTTPVPDHTHQPSSDTPHNSLETDLVSSTSPHPLPLVCVENTERGDKVCFAPSAIKTQQEEEEEEQFFSMAGYAHSSGEESEEPKTTLPNPIQKNLFSKSAPTFVEAETQPSTVDADYVIIDSIAPPINTSNEVPEPRVPDVLPSDALLAGKVATTPSTPVSTPPIHVRTHKKSHSLSGVMFADHGTEQERRLDTAQSNASSMMSIDSSKPTTTTTSSYTSSEDDEEDESAFETANEVSFKSKSGVSIDDSPFVSLEGSFPFKPYLVLDQERRASEDDVDGGADKEEEEEEERRKLSLIQERRYSLNVITNIDDFSASSEDDAGNQALRRSTRSPDSVTPTRQSTEMLSNRTTSEGDMTLSDIEVQVGSLEEDKMPQKTKESPPTNPAPLSPASRSPRVHQRTPSTPIIPSTSPGPISRTAHDAKHTIRLLKALTQEEPLPIKKSRSETLPAITMPSDPLIPVASARLPGGVLHTNISRNASSASDSVVSYQSSPPLQKGGVLGSSSLDFVKPPDGRSSARSSSRASSRVSESTTPLPPSPLYFSKSPRSSPRPSLVKEVCHSPTGRTAVTSVTSPLDKKAKSVDNLLDESTNQERDQKSVKFKQEDVEDDEEEFRGSQRKDIQSYLGIIDPMAREQPKSKGISKLFRRDSKKDKQRSTKKTDSLTSLDSVFMNNGQQSSQEDGKNGGPQPGKIRPNSSIQAMTSVPGTSQSPVIRKPRANTIHDINVTTTSELKALPDTRRLSGGVGGGGVEEEFVPPSSPRSKSEGSTTTEVPELPDENSLSVSIDDHPLLAEDDDTEVSWYQTIDRRLRRSINKHEKGRQGAIFDFIRTERHIHKSVLVLKLVFRDKLASELGMSEEILNHLFPSLDELMVVTEEFHNKLEEKQQPSSMMVSDISDILLEQFTGFYGKRMKDAYTNFICRQSEALELYRDLERRKAKFARLMTLLYAKKQCERRKLPDFYLLITQRVAKYVEMMKKLVKETDALKLDHLDRLKKADKALQELVASIDNGVLQYENRKKLEDIQSRLEIHVPRNYKQYSKLKGLKSLDLLAQNRVLINTVDVHWSGSGKSIAVLLVLVTDLIILLTEKDQKYHLATLHDMKPPVIRLYDLHVRVNASIRSGVQLLLLEQGLKPAMFYIEFSSKKEAKVWEERLNKAVEYCRRNDLKCEHLGVEPILSGDECKDEDEFDGDIDPLPDLSPEAIRRMMIHQALSQAHQHITMATAASLPNPPTHEVTARHSLATAPLAHRNHQLPPHAPRNKPVRSTTFHAVRTPSLDTIEPKKKKKMPDRGLSFLDKKDDPAQEKKNLLECISNLKDCVEYLLKENETKSEEMAKLRHELEEARSSNRSSPVSLFRSHSAQRPRSGRPHSIHSDLLKMEDLKKEGEKNVKFREGSPSFRLRNQ
ncbi:PREDICTED: uncharacterized protein LOC100638516 [Amphimedon queenslandica]|uniref:DH domain-containing protein n=1 Tax=Amphimedon queenslandica TaxID=400682 RepID=A0A1X7UTR8_AMPQE|nr:PREDICTED: uncharacterized protein LOC100638516 [Amphimedon queenslandica]|eukprot:XP_003386744.3 PREDICTED: uncharacterized protein LOC100638516 [Amphimedon queenslandica]